MAAKRTYYKERGRLSAAMLAFFGGFLGLHKFYLRETGGGIFYVMLFFITTNMFYFPISAILGVFDAMRLLMMPDSVFNRKYNRHLIKENRGYRNNPQSKVYDKPSRVKNNPFKKSGLKKYKEFELEEAILDFKKALEIDPSDQMIHFNLAGAYSLTEKKELIFQHLSRAVDMGFTDFEKIENHDDFAYLRIQPEFDDFKASGYRSHSAKANTRPRNSLNSRKDNLLNDDVLLSQLNKLKELRDKGVITENDFTTESKKLLRNA